MAGIENKTILFIVVAMATIVLAITSFNFFEKKVIKLGKKITLRDTGKR